MTGQHTSEATTVARGVCVCVWGGGGLPHSPPLVTRMKYELGIENQPRKTRWKIFSSPPPLAEQALEGRCLGPLTPHSWCWTKPLPTLALISSYLVALTRPRGSPRKGLDWTRVCAPSRTPAARSSAHLQPTASKKRHQHASASLKHDRNTTGNRNGNSTGRFSLLS